MGKTLAIFTPEIMFEIGQRVSVLTEDKKYIIDDGVVSKITPESEGYHGIYEITLDKGEKVEISTKDSERIIVLQKEEEGFFPDLNAKNLGIAALVILSVIGGSYVYMKQHHATPKVEAVVQTVVQPKSQIEVWAEEMAGLEKEKAQHYERQKYLREETKKSVDEVKKLDRKIEKIRDKIHLYVKPDDDQTD